MHVTISHYHYHTQKALSWLPSPSSSDPSSTSTWSSWLWPWLLFSHLDECDSRQWVLCQHSRFCAEDITGLGCNRCNMIKTSMIMISIMRIRESYENDPLADQHKQNCSSLFMCIPRHLGCNGQLNCLEGDASDETGCKSTSRMIMLMIMMIMIMVKGGGGYDFLPRHPTLRSFHDWWRCFNNHPSRECCVSLSGFFLTWAPLLILL